MRVYTTIGDIFRVNIGIYSYFFQFIARDRTGLGTDVIRVFRDKYGERDNPTISDIITGDVDFYSHTFVSLGVKRGLWEKYGHDKRCGTMNILFRCSLTSKSDKEGYFISTNWIVWKLNGELLYPGILPEEYYNSFDGTTFQPERIVYRIEHGKYPYKYYPVYDMSEVQKMNKGPK